MKVSIDQTYCIGSGLCQAIEPRVFAIGDDDGLARVRQGDRSEERRVGKECSS